MYSEILGMLHQDSMKDKSYLDLWGVMTPSPNLFGGSGLDSTSKPQPPSSAYSYLHPSLSRRSSNTPQQQQPAFGGLQLGRQSASSADISLDSPVGRSPLPLAPLTPLSAELPLHRRLDRSHSEPVTERKLAPQNSSRYKTELCRPFEESGQCKYGEKCQFAHGAHELRNMSRHPKYKTDLCRTFHTTGYCPYGARCHFVHNTEEQRRPRAPLGSAGEPPSPGSLSGSSSPTSMLFADEVYKSTALTPSPVPQPLHVFQFPPQRDISLLLALPPSPTPDSLASDLETMSLSSGGSASGSPPSVSPLDQPRHLRLPVFSRMRKDTFSL
ncbi:Protein TIS11 [Amphibalanus amphitrite]|uniref:Protein TIS11 n=2 Tax=Amphibalanus amphitrite TaxID=1232801 RepID=A0A6A4W485_AMPAM|nr:mRNA decay activator protein ZFP36L2-like isoform X1 [Amphibalanus amphitrite]KAF0296671.1 Protein TIS11 [Amphibalanus amphitrite]